MSIGNVKAQLFKTSKGFYLQELPKKGTGGAQCEMIIGSTWGEGDKLSLKNCEAIEKEYEDFLSWDMDVEVVMDPTPLTFMGRNLGRNLGILPDLKPKLDVDGCLILKRI
jgi:hypothetical protein